ncbi:MAG: hypothetical protein LWY06_02125 [Firmicutes bacterium]|nr:hypothetical protein [Bacillota bacterium]
MPSDEVSILGDLPGELRQLLFEAEDAVNRKDYVKAKFNYQKMADKYPDYVDGWFGLTRVYLLMKDYENSAKCYSFTIDVAPDFDPDPNLRVIIINSPVLAPGFIKALAQNGFYGQSIKFIDSIIDKDIDFDLKVDLLQLKEDFSKLYAEEKARAKEAERKKKAKETAMWAVSIFVLAGVLIGAGFWIYLFFQKSSARVAFGQGKNSLVLAEQKYSEYQKFNRNINEALTYYHDAQKYFEDSVATRADEYMSWYMLGVTYMKLRDIEFTRRVKGGPFDEKLASELLSKAKQAQENAIKYSPEFPDSNYELARVYFELLNKSQALEYCDKAMNYSKKVYSDDQLKLDQIQKQCKALKASINKNL